MSRISIFTLYFIGLMIFVSLVSITPTNELSLEPPSYSIPFKNNNLIISSNIFEDKTVQAGLLAQHLQGGKHLNSVQETLGSGACTLDYNNDGLLDLFVITGSGQTRYYGKREWWQKGSHNVLYENKGNNKFEDVTKQVGLTGSFWGMGCVVADLDNDGDQDLFITAQGENILYENINSTFKNVSSSANITGDNWSTTATVADFDKDGFLDIYVVNYLDFKQGNKTYETASGYNSPTPIAFNAQLYEGQKNKLYRNVSKKKVSIDESDDKKIQFIDVSRQAGIENEGGRGLAAQWVDINQDTYPDILISNDAGLPNAVFINNQNSTFTELSENIHLNSTEATTSIVAADFNNNGNPDIIYNTYNSNPVQFFSTKTSATNVGLYADIARQIGLNSQIPSSSYSMQGYGWGIGVADFNLDGWLDFISANGQVARDMDSPKQSQGQNDVIWFNQKGKYFVACEKLCFEILGMKYSSRSTVIADFDNDGDADIFITHNNDKGQLIQNNTVDTASSKNKMNWLGVKLIGTSDNKDAIGSTLILNNGSFKQYRYINNNSSFLSSGDKRILFGLGEIKKEMKKEINNKVTLDVIWPNGKKQKFSNINTNQYVELTQNVASVKYLTDHLINNMSSAPSLDENAWLSQQDSNIEKTNVLYALSDGKYSRYIEDQLFTLLLDDNADVRLNIIKLAGAEKTPLGLKLLMKSLSDKNADNRLIAVRNISDYESELSIYALLKRLTDKDEKIRCATANVFEYYFKEEEAVVNRKYLALPKLIRLLNDASDSVKICAADALSESDSFRAISPLLSNIEDQSEAVQVHRIRALGMLRDRKAQPYLLKRLQNKDNSPLILAHIFIALKRISHEVLSEQMSSLLNDSNAKLFIDAYKILITTDDKMSLIISSRDIASIVLNWTKTCVSNVKCMLNNTQAIKIALEIFVETHFTAAIPTIGKIFSGKNDSLVLPSSKALLRLIMQSNKDGFNERNFQKKDFYKQDSYKEGSYKQEVPLMLLTSENDAVIDEVMKFKIENNLITHKKDLIDLFENDKYRHLILVYWINNNKKINDELNKKIENYLINDLNVDDEYLFLVLSALRKNNILSVNIPYGLLKSHSMKIRKISYEIAIKSSMNTDNLVDLYTQYIFNEEFSVYMAGISSLFKAKKIELIRLQTALLLDSRLALATRLQILNQFLVTNKKLAKVRINSIINNPQDTLWAKAVENLDKFIGKDSSKVFILSNIDSKALSARKKNVLFLLWLKVDKTSALFWLESKNNKTENELENA